MKPSRWSIYLTILRLGICIDDTAPPSLVGGGVRELKGSSPRIFSHNRRQEQQ
jgi:hypothetical protein